MGVAPLGATTEALGVAHAAEPLTSSLHTATAAIQGEAFDLLSNQMTWVLILTIITIAINAVFEDAVHAAKKFIPDAYLPVLEKILGELTTLGFVSLVFQQAQQGGGLASFLDAQSEVHLG